MVFSANGPMTADFWLTPGISTISVASAGVYSIRFSATEAAGAMVFALADNGSIPSDATYGIGSSETQLYGQAILNLAAGDVISLRNGTGGSVALGSNVNASIEVNRPSKSKRSGRTPSESRRQGNREHYLWKESCSLFP